MRQLRIFVRRVRLTMSDARAVIRAWYRVPRVGSVSLVREHYIEDLRQER